MTPFAIAAGHAKVYPFEAPPGGAVNIAVSADYPVNVYLFDHKGSEQFERGDIEVSSLLSSPKKRDHRVIVPFGLLPLKWFLAVENAGEVHPVTGTLQVLER